MEDSQTVIKDLIDTEMRANRIPFAEAVSRTHAKLSTISPNLVQYLDEIVANRDTQLLNVTRISEKTTASANSARDRCWYFPPTVPNGVWEGLHRRISDSGLVGAVDSIDSASDAVMAHLAEPNLAGDRRLGIVVGNVQSGKTANYSAVIAKALDSGYRLVIVLSGLYTNLRQQTQRRLERDLGTQADRTEWFRLTSVDGDIGTADIKNASNIVSTNARTLAVVKKNSRRLSNLRDFLRAVDDGTMSRTPVLIIDDESDQATPDSSRDGADSPTAINRLMREVWATVQNGTYVGYTATPFANVFIDPDDRSDLYPSDFLSVLPTPESYFGAERLFGVGAASDGTPDVIRTIDRSELSQLAPKGTRAAETFDPAVTSSFELAIRWFIIGAAVRRTRGQTSEHSTMLVHTTHLVEPHRRMRDAVKAFLRPLQERALDGDVEDFRSTFHTEMNRAAELYSGDGPAPTWPAVAAEIPNVLRTLKVAVDNGEADLSERLNYETGAPQTVIVIGGGTLSRGLTLEGLFVSFFTRTTRTYDTLMQMGRWFGYRKGYEDLQRVWVSPGLDRDYGFLAEVEASLRLEIERMVKAGEKPARIGLRIKQHPGRLQITSKNKMKRAEKVAVDFEGSQLQPTAIEVGDLDLLHKSRSRVEQLLAEIGHHAYESDSRRQLVFRDVPARNVLDFLSDFYVHPRYREFLDDAIDWTRNKLPETPWNVVLASGNGEEQYRTGRFAVSTVNRGVQRLDISESGVEIEMRTMMAGADLVADLKILGRIPRGIGERLDNRDQLDLRVAKEGADGRGLLILYPISRSSKVRAEGNRNLGDLLLDIHSGKSAPQLFGMAMVAPFDVNNVIKDKGVFMAVRPENADMDIEEEFPIDDERDYQGDPA